MIATGIDPRRPAIPGIDHPKVVSYVELLSGRDLESLVREFGPVPADRVIFLLRQICHSLADAHARTFRCGKDKRIVPGKPGDISAPQGSD